MEIPMEIPMGMGKGIEIPSPRQPCVSGVPHFFFRTTPLPGSKLKSKWRKEGWRRALCSPAYSCTEKWMTQTGWLQTMMKQAAAACVPSAGLRYTDQYTVYGVCVHVREENLARFQATLFSRLTSACTRGVANWCVRGNKYKLLNCTFCHNLRKNYFSARVINIWNSLPNCVVDVSTINQFKACLDKFWLHQDILYDYTADLTGIGDRSVYVTKDE